jgi:hypothetical protein
MQLNSMTQKANNSGLRYISQYSTLGACPSTFNSHIIVSWWEYLMTFQSRAAKQRVVTFDSRGTTL